MAEAALNKKRYTYEDYLKTPEGWGYELILKAITAVVIGLCINSKKWLNEICISR